MIFTIKTGLHELVLLNCDIEVRSSEIIARRTQDVAHHGEERLKNASVIRRGIARDRIDELVADLYSAPPRHRQCVACLGQACVARDKGFAERRYI